MRRRLRGGAHGDRHKARMALVRAACRTLVSHPFPTSRRPLLQVIDRNFPATMPLPDDGSGRTNGTNSTPRWLPISTSS